MRLSLHPIAALAMGLRIRKRRIPVSTLARSVWISARPFGII
jgi:hypothetical protein